MHKYYQAKLYEFYPLASVLYPTFLSYFRGFVFPPIRGNRANKENRPIRQVYNNFRPSLRTNNDDILSNEIPSIDDSFLYQSSEEFESSNSYKKLKSYSNKGYYHLP